MNTNCAIRLSHEVAGLISLCARMQALYGRHYDLKPGSPTEAWELYQEIFEQQITIAEMLDMDALERPHYQISQWWTRQDTIDLTMAYKLMEEVNRLIAACAYLEANLPNSAKNHSYTLFCAQSVIAGTLHPSTIQVALGNLESRSQKAG